MARKNHKLLVLNHFPHAVCENPKHPVTGERKGFVVHTFRQHDGKDFYRTLSEYTTPAAAWKAAAQEVLNGNWE